MQLMEKILSSVHDCGRRLSFMVAGAVQMALSPLWLRLPERYRMDPMSLAVLRNEARLSGRHLEMRLRFAAGRPVTYEDVDDYHLVFGSFLIGGCDPVANPERLKWAVTLHEEEHLMHALHLMSASWGVTGRLPTLWVECGRIGLAESVKLLQVSVSRMPF